MSTERDDNSQPEGEPMPASPSWMQSQQPKVTESAPPKSRKPRRTKAQMAEARGSIGPARADDPNVAAMRGEDAIATVMAAEDTMHAHARDFSRLNYPRINRTWYERHGHNVPLAIATLALIVAIFALVK